MRYGLCGFLIIKPQIALHHALWCSAVHYYLWCSAVMPFCGQFWYGFCGFYGLVNTPTCTYTPSSTTLILLNYLAKRDQIKFLLIISLYF